MPAPLVLEHLDVVEQPHFVLAAGVEPPAAPARARRGQAPRAGIVVAVSLPAHAAGDAVRPQDGLLAVLTGAGTPLLALVEECPTPGSPVGGHSRSRE